MFPGVDVPVSNCPVLISIVVTPSFASRARPVREAEPERPVAGLRPLSLYLLAFGINCGFEVVFAVWANDVLQTARIIKQPSEETNANDNRFNINLAPLGDACRRLGRASGLS